MAKKTHVKVRLVPEAKPDSSFFYYVKKPAGGEKAKVKLSAKKYNPETRKHENFVQEPAGVPPLDDVATRRVCVYMDTGIISTHNVVSLGMLHYSHRLVVMNCHFLYILDYIFISVVLAVQSIRSTWIVCCLVVFKNACCQSVVITSTYTKFRDF